MGPAASVRGPRRARPMAASRPAWGSETTSSPPAEPRGASRNARRTRPEALSSGHRRRGRRSGARLGGTPVAMTTPWRSPGGCLAPAGRCVDPEVGEYGWSSRGPEGRHLLVELLGRCGRPRTWRSRLGPERSHQLVDRPGRDPVDVGLHDDRVRAWSIRRRGSKMEGKKLPFRSLGMASSTSPALVARPGDGARCARWSGPCCVHSGRRRSWWLSASISSWQTSARPRG